jgi:hypothetical protein
MAYGAGTKWCITMENTSYYEQYTDENVIFYFIISKNKDPDDLFSKVALAVHRNEYNQIIKVECFDSLDNQIDETELDIDNSIKNKITKDAENRPMTILLKIKYNKATSEEILQYYKANKNNTDNKTNHIRCSIADNSKTPQSVLVELAKDHYNGVRFNVARNRNTPQSTLIELAKDKDNSVRYSVATNYNTPPDTLAEMAKDSDPKLREYVAINPNTPKSIHNLAYDISLF